MTKTIERVLLGFLLVAHLLLAGSSVLSKNHTVDETVHLSAGYTYLATGDFRLNPEHPPLVKMVAALPLLALHLDAKTDSPFFTTPDQWRFAREFVYHNTANPEEIVLYGKFAVLFVFSTATLLVTFFWTRSLFGPRTALLATLLLAVNPIYLANAPLITTDVPLAGLYLLSVWRFVSFAQKPNWPNGFWFMGSLSLALLTKFSATLLAPVFAVVLVIAVLQIIRSPERDLLGYITGAFRQIIEVYLLRLIGWGLVILIVVWAFYGFEFGSFAQSQNLQNNLWRFTDFVQQLGEARFTHLMNLRIPLFSWINGFMEVYTHNVGGHDTYFFGELRRLGWKSYFPVLLLVKTPLPLLLPLLGGAVFALWQALNRRFSVIWHTISNWSLSTWALIVAPSLFLLFSINSHLNLGVRHVMPVIPFLCIAAALVLRRLQRFALGQALTWTVLAWSIAVAVWAWPNYLPYYNELAGNTGGKIGVDSNLDWGQDLKGLHHYLNDRGNPPIAVLYFGQADFDYYHINGRYLPTTEEIAAGMSKPPLVAISATVLFAQAQYRWLRAEEPITTIGQSIYIYSF